MKTAIDLAFLLFTGGASILMLVMSVCIVLEYRKNGRL